MVHGARQGRAVPGRGGRVALGRDRPRADRKAAGALGAALRRLGYSEEALVDLLGEDAYEDQEDVPVHARRLPRTPLAAAVRLLFLQLPTEAREVERALGRAATRALEATGLAEVGADVVPRARILPVGEVLLASDGFSRDVHDPPDYVASYTPTARICDVLTVRRREARALDVGTGSGIHALLAARHSGRVVATDVNPVALAYTELNARLNGLDNVECRHGSLFDAAGEERFDLITCNAPYVVSPERRWAYRDSGFWGDGVSERVVAGAAEHLAEGGFATVLVSWVGAADDPDEHVLEWAERTGCDAWILALYDADALEHGASWNAHLAGDPAAFGAAVDAWAAYVRELGAERVCEGAVILRRPRGGGRPTIRVDEAEPDELEDADGQIRRAFAARARLAELRRRSDLLDLTLAVASPLRVDWQLRRGRATVLLDEGTHQAVETTRPAVEVLERLDGRRSARNALGGADARQVLPLLRELLELGALRIVDAQ